VVRIREAEGSAGALGAALASDATRSADRGVGWLSTLGAWGALAAGDVGAQAAGVVGIGVGFYEPAFRLEGGGALRIASALEMQAPTLGAVELFELSPTLSATVLFDVEGVWVGGRVNAILRILRAVGTTRAGARAEATRVVPASSAGLIGRVVVTGPIAAELEAGVEVALDDRAFGVNRAPVGTVGRGRAYALVSLVISGH
jgi:hypothetical protein